MSRCFPFPPPGYEKKARTDDPDLLKKEKQREKKHRKEKKDKEKRESKEKNEKDRSDEKHREKKDKKEKHREKKEKDRNKDKDKSTNSDEKRLPGKSEGHDGEKTSNEKKLLPKSEGHNGEKLVQKKERSKDTSSISGEKKAAGQFSGSSGEKLSQNHYLAGDSKDSKFVQELGRRFRDEDRGTGNQLVGKPIGTDRKRDEGVVRLVSKSTGGLDGGKEKKRGVDDRKLDEQGVKDEARFSGNSMVQSLGGMVQTRAEGMFRSLEKDVDSKTEGKERSKQKEGDDKCGDKHKDKDRDKKGEGKVKDRDKEKKKEEKAKMKSGLKNVEKDILKNSNKDDLVGTRDMKTLHLPNDSDKNAINEGNHRKRKDSEMNGFYHANDNRPSKLPRPNSSPHALTETDKLPRPISTSHPLTETNKLSRPTSSPHSLTGNGKILESGQNPGLDTSNRRGSANNFKAENKERKINGIIASQPLSMSTAKPPITTAQAGQIADASKKPPHPDTKYLNEVLSIPKMEELSNFDNQEWLFHGRDSESSKPKVLTSGYDEMPEVWAEVMRIDSADVCALPYVVPF